MRRLAIATLFCALLSVPAWAQVVDLYESVRSIAPGPGRRGAVSLVVRGSFLHNRVDALEVRYIDSITNQRLTIPTDFQYDSSFALVSLDNGRLLAVFSDSIRRQPYLYEVAWVQQQLSVIPITPISVPSTYRVKSKALPDGTFLLFSESVFGRGFLARYNAQGQLLYSYRPSVSDVFVELMPGNRALVSLHKPYIMDWSTGALIDSLNPQVPSPANLKYKLFPDGTWLAWNQGSLYRLSADMQTRIWGGANSVIQEAEPLVFANGDFSAVQADTQRVDWFRTYSIDSLPSRCSLRLSPGVWTYNPRNRQIAITNESQVGNASSNDPFGSWNYSLVVNVLFIQASRCGPQLNPTTSLAAKQGTSPRLYPNPVRDYLTISLPTEALGVTHLTLRDMQGRVVKSARYEAEQPLYLGDVASGVYVLQLSGAAQGAWRVVRE